MKKGYESRYSPCAVSYLKCARMLSLIIIILSFFLISSHMCAAVVKVYEDVKQTIAEEGSADVIIIFENPNDGAPAERSAKIERGDKNTKASNPKILSDEVLEEVSDIRGFAKRRQLQSGYSGELTEDGLKNLIRENEKWGITVTVYENTLFYITADAMKRDSMAGETSIHARSDISTEPSILSSLATSTAAVKANYSWDTLNITGRGVNVAFLDTGIDYTHVDLGGCFGYGNNTGCKVFGGYDYYNNDSIPYDDEGHGTHVAGILGANGTLRGVAPEARIYAFKVCSAAGVCPTDVIKEALDNLSSYNIDVASLSLGELLSGDPIGNSGKYLLSKEVDEAVQEGIVVVVSAGNSGRGVSTIQSPGDAELVMTVGAVNDSNTVDITDDVVWRESSRGPSAFGRLDPDIVAPGADIISTFPPNWSYSLSGTSMAAPFVTGAAALMLEKYPSLNPSQVRAILMQSSAYVSGKVFERGAGELDIKNALVAPIYARVAHVNTYGVAVSSDRWEFVVTPYTTSYANITIINDFQYDSGYNFTFTISLENMTNLENSITLDTSQLAIGSSVNVAMDSNQTFNVNFTLSNFSNTYATTYGGIILLNGTGNNGTNIVNKTIRIPVVITVPILNDGYLSRTLYNPRWSDYAGLGYSDLTFPHEDVYYYCYYNPNPKNVTFKISWTGVSNDLDLFLYNSTGDFDVCANGGLYGCESSPDPEAEMVSTVKTDTFKWFRIDGWDFTSPLTFGINITIPANSAPVLSNITPINGSINATNTVLFYRPNNITLNITYYDLDNDTVTISANDTAYVVIENDSAPPNGYAVLNRAYNGSIPRNSTITIIAEDIYGATATQSLTILLYSSIIINSYTPGDPALYLRPDDSQTFTLDVTDMNNATLYYYWSVNGTLNATTQNFTFNTTGRSPTLYSVEVLISSSNTSNETNETLSWDVYVDGQAPSINIYSPSASHASSRVHINYSASDAYSGVDACWYSLNGTLSEAAGGGTIEHTNITLDSCSNISMFLGNGQYYLMIYSNDTLGNTGYSALAFVLNDTAAPNITASSPTGSLSYTTGVTLSVSTDENATCRYSPADVVYDLMNGTFTGITGTAANSTIVHTVSYSVGAGSYNISVRCRDMSNNTNNASNNIVFIVSSPPSGGTSPSRSSGSSSGTDVSYYYDPNSDFFSQVFGTWDEGENNISIDKPEIPVTQLTIQTYLPPAYPSLENVTINLSNVEQPDVNYTSDPVSSYIKLAGENIPASVVLSTEIYFSVTFEWLNSSNVTKTDVVLMLYDYDILEWKTLMTTLLNEDNVSVYYVAESPKFGLFAISSNQSHSKTGVAKDWELEKNMTLNKTLEPHTTSDEGNITDNPSGVTSSGDAPGAVVGSENSMLWVVWTLLGTFVLSVVLMFVIRNIVRKSYAKRYKLELIKNAKEEFENADNVLDEKIISIPDTIRKVPDTVRKIPDRLDDIRAKFSGRLEKELKDINRNVAKDAGKKEVKELYRKEIKDTNIKNVDTGESKELYRKEIK